MAGTNPLLGRHTTLEVAGVTFSDADGSYTIGSYTAIAAYYRDGESEETRSETENINGFGFNRNPVPIEQGGYLTVTEILRNQTAPSVLRALYNASSYIAIRRKDGSTYQETHVCLITSGRRGTAKGKNTYELTCETIEIGASNPAIVTS